MESKPPTAITREAAPRIVVLGEASAGKTTIINELIGMEIIPRRKSTNQIIHVTLIAREEIHPSISAYIDSPAFGVYTTVESLSLALKMEMTRGFSPISKKTCDIISVVIKSSHYIDADFYEIPSWEAGIEDVETSSKMKEICDDNKTIFLCILNAWRYSKAPPLDIARKFDHDGNRTLIILNKGDVVDVLPLQQLHETITQSTKHQDPCLEFLRGRTFIWEGEQDRENEDMHHHDSHDLEEIRKRIKSISFSLVIHTHGDDHTPKVCDLVLTEDDMKLRDMIQYGMLVDLNERVQQRISNVLEHLSKTNPQVTASMVMNNNNNNTTDLAELPREIRMSLTQTLHETESNFMRILSDFKEGVDDLFLTYSLGPTLETMQKNLRTTGKQRLADRQTTRTQNEGADSHKSPIIAKLQTFP